MLQFNFTDNLGTLEDDFDIYFESSDGETNVSGYSVYQNGISITEELDEDQKKHVIARCFAYLVRNAQRNNMLAKLR